MGSPGGVLAERLQKEEGEDGGQGRPRQVAQRSRNLRWPNEFTMSVQTRSKAGVRGFEAVTHSFPRTYDRRAIVNTCQVLYYQHFNPGRDFPRATVHRSLDLPGSQLQCP